MFRAYGGNCGGGGGWVSGSGGSAASNMNKSVNRKNELMRSTSVPSSAGSSTNTGSGSGSAAWLKPMSNGSINVTNSNQHIYRGTSNKQPNNQQQQHSNAISINNHQFYSILSQNAGSNAIASPVLSKEDHLKGIASPKYSKLSSIMSPRVVFLNSVN